MLEQKPMAVCMYVCGCMLLDNQESDIKTILEYSEIGKVLQILII